MTAEHKEKLNGAMVTLLRTGTPGLLALMLQQLFELNQKLDTLLQVVLAQR